MSTLAKQSHTCPIYEDNEIHKNFVSVPLSLRTASTVVWLGFGGVRVSRTLYDAYITSQESHYPGVLDNPQQSKLICMYTAGIFIRINK